MNENGNITVYNVLHSEGALWQSAEIAALKAATVIQNESVNTPRHTERLQWMYNVIADPDAWVQANKWNIVQAGISLIVSGSAATDNNVEAVVNGLVPV